MNLPIGSDCNELHYSENVTLCKIEKEYIIKALEFHKNHKLKTAKKLGISVRTLHNKLEIYGLSTKYRKRALK